jgi:predicted ATP-grasp superfamily ATP-dependent carboligase
MKQADDFVSRRRPMRAFVTDGDQRAALAVTRSLGRRGVMVIVGDERSASLASRSRYCVRHVTYPSPYREPGAFDRFLLEFLARERVDVVIPVTDVTTYATARNRERLERYSAIAAPPFDAFDLVSDKRRLLRRALELGIPIPRTHFVDGVAGLNAIIDQVEYPAVVKPARSRICTNRGWVPTTVRYAHSTADLLRLYRDVDYLAAHPSMIQERIEGPGMGVFVLCDHGQLRAAFAHRRLREKPPSGGASVLSESLAVDPRLLDEAMRLLGPLGWHGVAMVEYKQDRRTGQPILMEVNGRFWGSLQLAVDAGVDFPYLTYQLSLGWQLDVPTTYKVGLRSRWLLGDLDHLYLRLKGSDRDLPRSAPSKSRAVMEFLKPVAPGLTSETFKRDDPGPAVHELWNYTKTLWTSVGRRMRS